MEVIKEMLKVSVFTLKRKRTHKGKIYIYIQKMILYVIFDYTIGFRLYSMNNDLVNNGDLKTIAKKIKITF